MRGQVGQVGRIVQVIGLVFGALIIWFAARPVPALAQDPNAAKITEPLTGDVLIGRVAILGTASHPNMQRYLLQFDSQDDAGENWLPIAGPISQQVKDGPLAQWDTTPLPDGRYQIRLRVVLRDGAVLSDVIQNLRISNSQPTALPTVPQAATAVPPTLPPTAGPSPTPIIQQPPTSTPRPIIPTVAQAVAPPTAPTAEEIPQVLVAFDALQNAFCSGVYLAIFAFIVIGGYSLIHVRARPAMRRFMRQLRDSYRE